MTSVRIPRTDCMSSSTSPRRGFHTAKDTALTVESLSEQYDTEIISVKADGIDVDLSSCSGTVLKVGESCKIKFKEHALPKSTEPFTVTVVYSLKNGKIPFVKSRTFTFTAMGDGEYDNFVFLSGRKPDTRQRGKRRKSSADSAHGSAYGVLRNNSPCGRGNAADSREEEKEIRNRK